MNSLVHLSAAALASGKLMGSYQFCRDLVKSRALNSQALSRELMLLGATGLVLTLGYQMCTGSKTDSRSKKSQCQAEEDGDELPTMVDAHY